MEQTSSSGVILKMVKENYHFTLLVVTYSFFRPQNSFNIAMHIINFLLIPRPCSRGLSALFLVKWFQITQTRAYQWKALFSANQYEPFPSIHSEEKRLNQKMVATKTQKVKNIIQAAEIIQEFIKQQKGQAFNNLIKISMATPATRRLLKDLQKIEKEEDSGINATPEEDNLFLWEAIIEGPEKTPWEGGLFELKLEFTENYPTKAPNVSFKTEIFHPNVYSDGRLCLDILMDQWSPVYDVWAILTSVRSLLCDPNPASPANSEAARLFQDNKMEYERRVKKVVQKSLE